MVKANCCDPKVCSDKYECNHYRVQEIFKKRNFELMKEDLSSLCGLTKRLFIHGRKAMIYPNRFYYMKLLSFFDNDCTQHFYFNDQCIDPPCLYCEKIKGYGLYLLCKKGKGFSCNHPKHPDNQKIALCLINAVKKME